WHLSAFCRILCEPLKNLSQRGTVPFLLHLWENRLTRLCSPVMWLSMAFLSGQFSVSLEVYIILAASLFCQLIICHSHCRLTIGHVQLKFWKVYQNEEVQQLDRFF
ncbi:hypothetical protein DBR06_SOUSAS8110032, partial [Sousa chinensis]